MSDAVERPVNQNCRVCLGYTHPLDEHAPGCPASPNDDEEAAWTAWNSEALRRWPHDGPTHKAFLAGFRAARQEEA